MTDLKLLDQLNNSPLSKAVRPLLNDPYSGNLHLKQFMIEMVQDALSRHQTRYWTYMLRIVLTILEDSNANPRQTYNLLINNPNLEQTDELLQRQEQMLEQAKKQQAEPLFENLLDNLTSNLNLEPEYPELL